MSEKRFQKGMNLSCFDTETGKSYWYACNLCSLLNELVTKCHSLEKENNELNSIKKFAEKNGINIFLIDEAFRKCWKDNEKLFEENEKLRQRNRRLYKCALYGKTIGDETNTKGAKNDII